MKPYLRTFFLLLFLIATLSAEAFAQTTITRRLPPSLERELKLRKGGKARIIGFTDTLKAQTLIAKSIRDSSVAELDSNSVSDSAIVVMDSSVSLTDKEWLDSMLAELPEYRMTPEGIRFQYPPEILIETTRKTVPFDSTLPSRMDPVSKEDLPLYDASPMPKPLSLITPPRTSVELGIGAPYLPRIDIHSLVISNERTSFSLGGKYFMTGADAPATKQFWKLGANGSFVFPSAEIPIGEQVPQLDIGFLTGANKRLLVSSLDSANHNLSNTSINAGFTVGSPSQLKLRSHAMLSLVSDDIGGGNSERQQGVDLSLLKDITNSSFRLQFNFRYQGAGSIGSTFAATAPGFIEPQLLLEQKENDPLQWRAGISYLSGSDAGGSSSLFLPIISFRTHLTHSLEVGAGFEPKHTLIGLRELLATNLFYSPAAIASSVSKDSLFKGDARRIVSEPIQFNAFANYFLSVADELHAELRYIERRSEPVFAEHIDTKGHVIFDATPGNTRRLEFEAGGSVLLFAKDKFTTSLLFRSASVKGKETAIAFEPNLQIQAIYEFAGLSEKFIPSVDFQYLSRSNKSLSFLNLAARYEINEKFHLKFKAENIFGSAGDFWTSYNEYPRSVLLSAQYAF